MGCKLGLFPKVPTISCWELIDRRPNRTSTVHVHLRRFAPVFGVTFLVFCLVPLVVYA